MYIINKDSNQNILYIFNGIMAENFIKLRIITFLSFILLLPLFFNNTLFAAIPPASQQMSGQERARQMQEEEEYLKNQVERQKRKAKPEEKITKEVPEGPAVQRVLVKSIIVAGASLFPKETIRAITGPYENKELTLNEIRYLAGLITDLYRKKGYVTSRAYIPPQKMEQGILEIRVMESTVGDIQVKGNRYHSTRLIKSYLTIQKGAPFNYFDLKKGLRNINDNPDINVKAILASGQKPGSTDIVLEVKDALPVHVSFGVNNYLSTLLRRSIYSSSFTDNNLLGQNDILTFRYENGDYNDYYSYTTRYQYPVTRSLDLGVYASRSKQVLGGEFADVDSRGKSRMYGAYGSQELIKNDYLNSHFNFGFDYMDVYNFLFGTIFSQDRLRVAKAGFDLDISDDFGRTFISDDYNYGIPGIMGGTGEHLSGNDTPTSRLGAGGEFIKDTLNILRLEQLPFDSTLLWKNQLQFSPSTLTATEQFQAGGPANNRGFPVAGSVGDEGYTMSWELAEPPYSMPKLWKVPFTNEKIYDAVRVIEFYDWSNIHLNSLQPGDKKSLTLSSAGCGLRVNILKYFSASYQIAWPMMGRASEGKGVQNWFEATLTF